MEVDQICMPFLMGDCFLICSDGLSNYLEDEDLRRLISGGFYSEVPRRMVDMANLKGGDDNITVVLVYAANDARLLEPVPSGPQEPEQTEEIEFDPYAPTWVPEMESDPED